MELTREKIETIIQALITMREAASDEQAFNASALYPAWKENVAYSIGVRVVFEKKLYKCVQAHTSQLDWIPTLTPALWVLISVEEWPEWVQPSGAHDAYSVGDKVSYDGKHWICTSNTNAYQPGVYGWEEQK